MLANIEVLQLLVAERRHLIARGFNPGIDAGLHRESRRDGICLDWMQECRPSGTSVGVENGDLGLKSEANECRRSATQNLK